MNDHGVDFDGGMFAFLDGKWPPQSMPCYDENLEAMGAPKSCTAFAAEGMCSGDVGGGSTIADYCPEACGVCERSYTPPRSKLNEEDDMNKLLPSGGEVKPDQKMGYVSTVEDARKSLENIFKNNIEPNNP